MKISKKNLVSCFMLFVSVVCFAMTMDEVLDLKFELYQAESTEKALETINEFMATIDEKDFKNYEEYLAAKNIIGLEALNFSDPEANAQENFALLDSLHSTSDAYIADKNVKRVNKYLLVSLADVKSRILEFLSPKDMYKQSMVAKDLYTAALRQDKKFAYALNGYGTWLFFAPEIAGGGNDAALKTYSKALKYTDKDFEKFFLYINRSQVYFKLKRMKDCKADLELARSLVTNDAIISEIEEKNKNGKTFFD